MIGRRGFISGIAALIAAPAIVRAASLMPVRSFDGSLTLADYAHRYLGPAVDANEFYRVYMAEDGAVRKEHISGLEWYLAEPPRLGDVVRVRVPEKFTVVPFGHAGLPWVEHRGIVVGTPD